MFSDTEIEKHKFLYCKNLILIDDVDIDKILMPKKIYFGKKSFKYFIGYKDNEKFKSLCIMLPKMREYTKILMRLNIGLFK